MILRGQQPHKFITVFYSLVAAGGALLKTKGLKIATGIKKCFFKEERDLEGLAYCFAYGCF